MRATREPATHPDPFTPAALLVAVLLAVLVAALVACHRGSRP